MSPQFVKRYSKGNKNDPNATAAICEAVTRPSMRFVPVKSKVQQEVQALYRVRERLLRSRTEPVNQVRGLLGEQGIVPARGIARLRRLLTELLAEPAAHGLCALFRDALVETAERLRFLDQRLGTYDLRIERVFADDERCLRYLRTLLIHGARSALCRVERRRDPRSRWASRLKLKRGFNVAAVALVNKNARIIWRCSRAAIVTAPRTNPTSRLNKCT